MMKINMEVYLNHDINDQAPHSWGFLFIDIYDWWGVLLSLGPPCGAGGRIRPTILSNA